MKLRKGKDNLSWAETQRSIQADTRTYSSTT